MEGPVRFELPGGVGTVIGALPDMSPLDTARFVTERLPALPSTALDLGPRDVVGPEGGARPAPRRVTDDLRLAAFVASVVGRDEPLVVAVTGPITLAHRLLAGRRGVAAAADDGAAVVVAVALEVIAALGRTAPEAQVVLVLDEADMTHSMHPAFPFGPARIEATIGAVVEALAPHAMMGVKVDGRADFAMLLRTGISVLAAPVDARLETAAAEVARFLERGGFVAWGAVPTDEPLGESGERFWRRLDAVWRRLIEAGGDPWLLRERALITPAVGLGGVAPAQAERLVDLMEDVGRRLARR